MDLLNRVEGSVDDQRKIRRTNLKSSKGEVYIFHTLYIDYLRL